jgi:hypothetical protein
LQSRLPEPAKEHQKMGQHEKEDQMSAVPTIALVFHLNVRKHGRTHKYNYITLFSGMFFYFIQEREEPASEQTLQ